MSPSGKKSFPRLIAWEVTRRCSLNCLHCRASAQDIPYQNELSLDECKQLIDGMTQFTPTPIMILTGGDPMMRPDIFDIIEYGNSLGLRMVIALCGQHLSPDIMRHLKESGIMKVSFSLDGSTAESHDAFRRVPGSFDAVMESMAYAREANIAFQVNSTISKYNVSELPGILDLVITSGADSFHPFLLVPTGNAKDLLDMELAPEEYEKTLRWIYEKSQEIQAITVKPTCAPHYYRIVRQEQKGKPKPQAAPHEHGHPHEYGGNGHAHGHGFSSMAKGCLGGQGFAFVSHTGKVQICGFLDVECGDVRDTDFQFKPIWETSQVFQKMRDRMRCNQTSNVLRNSSAKCWIRGFIWHRRSLRPCSLHWPILRVILKKHCRL